MGIDRHIIAKRDFKAGECVGDIGRAYHLAELPDDHEIYIELWRLIRLYDSDFEAFINGVRMWVEDVKNCGVRDMLFRLCDEYSDLEWRDE